MFHQGGGGGLGILRPAEIILRRERQTFSRLPESGAVCFTVRTSMSWLTELGVVDLAGLAREIKTWPQDVAEYRGFGVWGNVVLRYCDERCAGSTGERPEG